MTRKSIRQVLPDRVPRECIIVRRTPEQRYTTARIDVVIGDWKVVALRFHRSAIDKVAYTYFNGPRKGSPVWELYVMTDGYLEEFVRYAEAWEAEHLDRAVDGQCPVEQSNRERWESYTARRAS